MIEMPKVPECRPKSDSTCKQPDNQLQKKIVQYILNSQSVTFFRLFFVSIKHLKKTSSVSFFVYHSYQVLTCICSFNNYQPGIQQTPPSNFSPSNTHDKITKLSLIMHFTVPLIIIIQYIYIF